ncbi:MAG: carbamoyl-phosphate synthase large subunit [Clostridiales bacterium]|nr:carbamoyl-phosphate synthase large subunit [Clostridiales bacterium]
MPFNQQIKKVLVIGSGPIVIGQAAEFDYSGTQACQALKEEGVEVVLVNSNPATIMTDSGIADHIYIEPITVEYVEKIIAKERPDSLLAGMGGQTALNMALMLSEAGILDRYNVQLIGTKLDGIKQGEDRDLFKKLMERIEEPIIQSTIVTNIDEGLKYAEEIGYPVIIRPAYTLGGTGGGIADTEAELKVILKSGLQASPVHQVLLEKSIKGWKEVEYEVMRDGKGNCISVCNMENLDPVGIHTGDSIVVAPSQTLSDKEYQMLRTSAFNIIEAIEIEGGCNVQFALNPHSFEYAVIEINPRVSRSSALASKATGYPIAKVAAKIALGYGLDEIKNAVTDVTYACFEPSLDYVVVKIPKWPFDKFGTADRILGTKMMATGEIMAIGSNFEAAFMKGIRSLELGQYHLQHKKYRKLDTATLKKRIVKADDERIFALAELMRRGYRLEKIAEITGIDMWFLKKLSGIVAEETKLEEAIPEDMTSEWMRKIKRRGFSDKGIADLLGTVPETVYQFRKKWNIEPVFHMVDTCGGEFEAVSPYYYSSYETVDEVTVSDRRKVMVIGSGPIRIGQGIEFDYASVQCVRALKNLGYETIIVNNNPETVSTDFNISDKLYFEPLTEEDVLSIIDKEKPDGVMLQFGGQTAIKLAKFMSEKNIPIFGTDAAQIDLSEDREKFDEFLESVNINRPKGKGVFTMDEGLGEARVLGYPVIVRPSYVLGGQGMEICYSDKELTYYLENAFEKDKKNPVLIDKYLMGKEIEVDAISDGKTVLIPGIMEHLERAGVHSGDSMTLFPAQSLSKDITEKVIDYTQRIALGIGIKGMINIQFIEYEDNLYVIEVNPRASRTVPYITKVSGVPIVDLATRASLGEPLDQLGYGEGLYPAPPWISVKVPVFSTHKLPRVEVSLGPEMKSTGEVLGIGKTVEEALFKGFLAAKYAPQVEKPRVLMTLRDKDKAQIKAIAPLIQALNAEVIATPGTAKALAENGISAKIVNRIDGDEPTVIDLIQTGDLDLIVNTPTRGNDATRDGFTIRRAAAERSIPTYTSMDTFVAWAKTTLKIKSADDTDVYALSLMGVVRV